MNDRDSDLPARLDTAEGLDDLLASIPYARFLGLRGEIVDGQPVLLLPRDRRLVGNPVLPAIHGGVVGALLESTALCGAMWLGGLEQVPKIITITIDYLRSARLEDTRARATMTRQGRRVLTMRAEAHQDDPTRPVAAAHAHLLIRQP